MARILVSYFFGPDTIPLGEQAAAALEAIGHTVYRHDCRAEHPLHRHLLKPLSKLARPLLGRGVDFSRAFGIDSQQVQADALIRAVAGFRPDWLLVLRGHPLSAELLADIRLRWGVRTAAWWLYGPEAHADLLADQGRYDHYASIYDSGLPGVATLPALAVDRQRYHPDPTPQPTLPQIAFVGRHSPRRDAFLPALADLPLAIWGAGWRKPKLGWRPRLWQRVRGSGLWGEPLRQTYARSAVVLNVSVWDPAREPGLNLRVLDVPACGGFLLTDHSDELAEWMTPGRHIDTWRCAAELRDKLRYYLDHPAARDRMAKAGLERSLVLPDYRTRMAHWCALAGVGDPQAG